MKLLIKVFIGFAVLLVVIGIGLASLVLFSDPNQYKQVLSQKFKETTGADIEMNGDFKVTFFPSPGMTLHEVTFQIPADKTTNYSIQAQTLSAKMHWSAIMGDNFTIKKLVATKGTVSVIKKGKSPEKYRFDKLSAKIDRTNNGWEVPSFTLASDDTKVEGKLTILKESQEGARTKISGKLKAQEFDLASLKQDSKTSMPKSKKVIPKVDIPYELLKDTDFDITLQIEKMPLGDTSVKEIALTIKAENGKAVIHPFTAKLYGGDVDGTVSIIRTKPNQGKVEASLNGKQLEIDKILIPEDKSSGIHKGRFDVHLEGHSWGSDLRRVLGEWQGKAHMVLGETIIKNTQVKGNLGDVAFGFLSFLNPFEKKDNDTHIQCAAMNYTIKNGTAFAINKVAVETRKIDVLGSGKINLKNENIDFEFTLRKKSGIDIPLGNFDKYIRLEGTLGSPSMVLNPKGVIEEGVSIFSAIATGGMSLVVDQVFDTLSSDKNPCQSVMSE